MSGMRQSHTSISRHRRFRSIAGQIAFPHRAAGRRHGCKQPAGRRTRVKLTAMPAPDFSSPRAGASQPPAPTASSIHAGIVRSAGVVSAAVLFSRITGLVREVVFAKYFGAGMVYDAFVAAFRIPNLLRDLLAEGALSAAFVTTFSRSDCRTAWPRCSRRCWPWYAWPGWSSPGRSWT